MLHYSRLTLAVLIASLSATASAKPMEIGIGYLGQIVDKGPVLSNILPEPDDSGLQGAKLAITDSNTTGRFLHQHYRLEAVNTASSDKLITAAKAMYRKGTRLFVLNTPTATIDRLHSTLGQDALLINAGSEDDQLRTTHCVPGLLHTIPSRAMLADALGQWLAMRRWNHWMLIDGSQPGDIAFSDAIKRAAKRFGGKIVAEKKWSFDTDLRRTAQKELPPFTSGTDYDVLVVADERGDFGEYLPYNTGYPRPVVGTQGLTPVGWHRAIEAWGAAQLQSRFEAQSGRWMNTRDYAAWAAVRTFANAVTHTTSANPAELRKYILSDKFELGAFKGRKLTYRRWSGQLRQPIPLVQPRALVSQSPQQGFLHPRTELDTLGYDLPESQCRVAPAN